VHPLHPWLYTSMPMTYFPALPLLATNLGDATAIRGLLLLLLSISTSPSSLFIAAAADDYHEIDDHVDDAVCHYVIGSVNNNNNIFNRHAGVFFITGILI